MMRTLAIIPFLVTAPVIAQDIKPGDVAAAMNGLGDVLMVWEAQVDATGQLHGDLTRIEGTFLRRRSSSTWRPFATATLGEADPAILAGDMVYASGDNCSTPSVEAVGDHFVVSFTRSDGSGKGESLRRRSVRAVIADLVSGVTPAVAYKRAGRPWLAVNKLTRVAPAGLALAHLETDPTATNQGWLAVITRGDVAGDSRCHVLIARL